ncbi:MAG: hypothetical protein CML66_08650 [Rhodobacteraceae bacterium]|nr:hypothetical protein [Paracoccaceae bacterium]
MASSFAGSFITASLGLGGGIFLLAVMASLLPPAALIPVHGVVQLGSNAGRAALLIRQVYRPALAGFVAGALVGAAVGGVVVVDLPPRYMQIGIGLFVIWSILAKPPKWLARSGWLAGGLSSFLTMFFGATGPFVATYVKSLKLPRHDHVATHAVFMTIQHGLKVIVFGLLGFAFSHWALLIAALIAAGFAGTYAGRMVLDRMSDHGFRRALDIVLVLISIRLIWSGLAG